MNNPIEQLTNLFEKFPGIGPRQAGRFVQFLLRSPSSTRREIAEAIQALSMGVRQCSLCMRYHSDKEKVCAICIDARRDSSLIAVVASDADLSALEKSGTYHGLYFVLGGTISLASEKMNGLRIQQLLQRINDLRNRYDNFNEIILALPANPEGDATAIRLREEIVSKWQGKTLPFRITALGRGLSTGSELEYADSDTLKGALENRR